MSDSALCSVYVTAPDPESARKIARHVLTLRLAACANILPGVGSLYWWDGKLAEDSETVLVFKTQAFLFEKLSAAVKEIHPYQVPCIVQWPVTAVLPEYASWVRAETSQEAK